MKKYTKKSLEILLHMSAINDNHMMYGSWGIECNWRMFLSSWIISCPFTPLNSPKNQNFEKYKKKTWRHYHFTHVYHKWQSYDVWFLRYEVQQTEVLSFWTIFCHFTPLKTWRIKILKKRKNHLEISFYTNV